MLNIDIELQQNIEKVLEEEMKKAVIAPNSRYYNSSYIVVTNPNNGNVIALVGKKINKDQTFSDYSYYNVINSFKTFECKKTDKYYIKLEEGKSFLYKIM